jgi:DNA-binding CsgD family transcriptional regulator
MKSLMAREKNNDKSGIAKTYIFLGNYYQTTDQLKRAEEYANKAREIGLEMKEQLTIVNSTMMLYQINKTLGKTDIALQYHEQFKQASDSLINAGKIEEITRLQIQYNYEKTETEREIKQQRTKYTFIIALSTLSLIIVILALLFILARNRNKRIKLENEILEESMDLKNKELTANVIYHIKKNELIDNISLRLLNMKEKLKPENREPVQKIIYDIQSLTEENVWDEFELRFQNVHQKFYDNLQRKFPDLTPSEIKLAALLKLNMTTKEIASLTGQSVNSLETARYRLRKKLGITNQEINLVNFLLKI